MSIQRKNIDKKYMKEALKEARKAFDKEEVPIGAVIVYKDKIIARGHNLKEKNNDPTAHAEIITIKKAAAYLSSWRLNECDLYVTIEPCPMCAGAIVQARLKRLVYGAKDKKAGAAGTLYNLVEDNRFNHQTKIINGVMAKESRDLIQEFFKKLRD
ncbi:MAG: tRNA adenosine(34) deaminase TadA [Nanoarchaeota archaeon]